MQPATTETNLGQILTVCVHIWRTHTVQSINLDLPTMNVKTPFIPEQECTQQFKTRARLKNVFMLLIQIDLGLRMQLHLYYFIY